MDAIYTNSVIMSISRLGCPSAIVFPRAPLAAGNSIGTFSQVCSPIRILRPGCLSAILGFSWKAQIAKSGQTQLEIRRDASMLSRPAITSSCWVDDFRRHVMLMSIILNMLHQQGSVSEKTIDKQPSPAMRNQGHAVGAPQARGQERTP